MLPPSPHDELSASQWADLVDEAESRLDGLLDDLASLNAEMACEEEIPGTPNDDEPRYRVIDREATLRALDGAPETLLIHAIARYLSTRADELGLLMDAIPAGTLIMALRKDIKEAHTNGS
jgi:hypothetical protein